MKESPIYKWYRAVCNTCRPVVTAGASSAEIREAALINSISMHGRAIDKKVPDQYTPGCMVLGAMSELYGPISAKELEKIFRVVVHSLKNMRDLKEQFGLEESQVNYCRDALLLAMEEALMTPWKTIREGIEVPQGADALRKYWQEKAPGCMRQAGVFLLLLIYNMEDPKPLEAEVQEEIRRRIVDGRL